MSNDEFFVRPASDMPIVPIITLSAAENWPRFDAGLMHIHFAKRARSGIVVRYASITNVPRGSEGRAVIVWILAHPWRIASIIRMTFAFVAFKRKQVISDRWLEEHGHRPRR